MTLAQLNLFNNRIIRVPASFEKLANLDDVNFGGNRLKTFVRPGGWKRMTRLAIQWNMIVILPSFEGADNLRQLQVNDNQIEEMPVLGAMTKVL